MTDEPATHPTRRWEHDDTLHAWWVTDQILAGEYPASYRHDSKSAEKVALLLDAGVRTIIDLTTPRDGLDSYDDALRTESERRGISVTHVGHPIPDMDVIDRAGYDDILATLDDGLARGVVYIHCWGGKGRTSTVVGRYLRRSGLSYEETIDEIERLRAGTRKAWESCPEAQSQHRMLRLD
ncbi:MAG: serine/threonine protein phosphatase [Acidimicrobiales bacterium]